MQLTRHPLASWAHRGTKWEGHQTHAHTRGARAAHAEGNRAAACPFVSVESYYTSQKRKFTTFSRTAFSEEQGHSRGFSFLVHEFDTISHQIISTEKETAADVHSHFGHFVFLSARWQQKQPWPGQPGDLWTHRQHLSLQPTPREEDGELGSRVVRAP